VPLEIMPHLAFKHLCRGAKATVRTGDTVPYANIIIVSG
jgi:D-ribose pyranase